MAEVTVVEGHGSGPKDEVVEPDPKAETAAEEKVLKQSEVDAIVEQRLARERKKYADYEALKQKADAFDAAESEKLSELERANKAREAAEKQRDEALAAVTNTKIQSAIQAEAAKAGVSNVRLLSAVLDTTGVTVGDDGLVTGVEAAVKAALAENPELVGARANSGSADQGARGGGPDAITQEAFDALSIEDRYALIVAGKVRHLL